MLSNAVVHQDFSKNGGRILVECFPDRLEMNTAGTRGTDVDRIVDYEPRPQNRHFVELLSRFWVAKAMGRVSAKSWPRPMNTFCPPSK